MGVEFRLGRQDGHKVEDFLARQPKGVTAITLSTPFLRHQVAAAEAAMALDADVLFEPLTERLVAPGFQLRDFTYGQSGLLSTAELSRDANARTRLVRDVVGGHPDTATLVTPPHFYVEDDHGFELNIALAEEALQTSKREIRPVLLVNRVYADKNAAGLANSYAMAGITRLELRLTPVGGDDESLRKIRSVFAICAAFTAAGIEVTLGASGNIGHAAVALGHAAHYSVGVGLLEQVDYKAAINRQGAPPKPVEDKKQNRGAIAGIYLPGLMGVVGRQHGAVLLANTDIRTKIGCRLDSCGTNIKGPAVNPREHYLHARAHEIAQSLAQPEAWRVTLEQERLRRAVELRELINEHHPVKGMHPFKTRTLRALLDPKPDGRALSA